MAHKISAVLNVCKQMMCSSLHIVSAQKIRMLALYSCAAFFACTWSIRDCIKLLSRCPPQRSENSFWFWQSEQLFACRRISKLKRLALNYFSHNSVHFLFQRACPDTYVRRSNEKKSSSLASS